MLELFGVMQDFMKEELEKIQAETAIISTCIRLMEFQKSDRN